MIIFSTPQGGGGSILNVRFIHLSANVGDLSSFDVCDPEFAAHAPVAVTIITSHRLAAASRTDLLRAGVHLLRANADVAPWLVALLAGAGGERGWSAGAGAAAALVTLAVRRRCVICVYVFVMKLTPSRLSSTCCSPTPHPPPSPSSTASTSLLPCPCSCRYFHSSSLLPPPWATSESD